MESVWLGGEEGKMMVGCGCFLSRPSKNFLPKMGRKQGGKCLIVKWWKCPCVLAYGLHLYIALLHPFIFFFCLLCFLFLLLLLLLFLFRNILFFSFCFFFVFLFFCFFFVLFRSDCFFGHDFYFLINLGDCFFFFSFFFFWSLFWF